MDVSVHPGFYGRGIGTGLTRLAEARTRELSALPPWTALGSPGGQDGQVAPPAVQVSLNSGIVSTNEAARQLLEEEGFSLIRHFLRMQIDMNGAPPEVSLPDGMTLRSLVPGRDEYATFTAMEEAFQDHWGYLPWHFETWQQLTIQRADFDPSLWFLAIDGDQIAGGALCYNFAEEGWVNQLAVRRAWRNQGLGLALLCHSFREFYERDQRRVSLQVDSQNTSGATRLYQRAGMHIVRQFDLYQKVVGGGEEHP
jgi:mycothiol synthase